MGGNKLCYRMINHLDRIQVDINLRDGIQGYRRMKMVSKSTCSLETQKSVARVWAKHCWEFTLHSSCSSSKQESDCFCGSHLPNSKSHQGKPRKTSCRSMAPLLTLRHKGTTSLAHDSTRFKTSRSWGIESQELKAEYKKRKASKSLERTRVDTS